VATTFVGIRMGADRSEAKLPALYIWTQCHANARMKHPSAIVPTIFGHSQALGSGYHWGGGGIHGAPRHQWRSSGGVSGTDSAKLSPASKTIRQQEAPKDLVLPPGFHP